MTGHDSAAALVSQFPSPQEIKEDIAILEEFVSNIQKRAKDAEKDIKFFLEPPQAEVSNQIATDVIDLNALAAAHTEDSLSVSP